MRPGAAFQIVLKESCAMKGHASREGTVCGPHHRLARRDGGRYGSYIVRDPPAEEDPSLQ